MKSLILTLSLLFSFSSLAQEAITAKEQIKRKDKAKEGWTPKLKLSLNYSIDSSNNVIGQTDGDSIKLGGKIESAYDYAKDTREWRNSLNYSGATTRTASLPRYVKSDDSLKLATVYLYGFKEHPNVGPYISGSAETSVFKGEDIQSENKTYTINTNPVRTENRSSLKLTDPFKPLTTKEAVGFFYKAISRPKTTLEFRLGVGAMQVNAEDQLKVSESTDTTVTVDELESYSQVGVEYGFIFKGKWNDKSDYSISGDFLTPMGTDIDDGDECDDCDELELTNIELEAKASTKVSDWLTVSYSYKAIEKPQLLKRFQTQHGFVLNAVYDFFAQ